MVRGCECGIGGRRGGPQPKGCARPMPGAVHAPTGPAGEQAPPPTGCQHRRPVMSRRASGPTVTAPHPFGLWTAAPGATRHAGMHGRGPRETGRLASTKLAR